MKDIAGVGHVPVTDFFDRDPIDVDFTLRVGERGRGEGGREGGRGSKRVREKERERERERGRERKRGREREREREREGGRERETSVCVHSFNTLIAFLSLNNGFCTG